MSAYLIVLFLVASSSYFGRRYGSPGVEKLSLIFSVLVLIFFAGLRDQSVGTDTYNYVSFLEKILTVEDVFGFKLEVGFNVLVLFSGNLSEGYFLLLTSIASIVVVCYFYTIIRLTKNYEIAIFIFIAFGAYTFFFNGARQGIATAICFLALTRLLDRKLVSYLVLIGLATLFHKSALVAIPLYFLARPRFGWREILLILFGVVLISEFLPAAVQIAENFIDARYASYGEEEEGGGRVQAAFLLAQGVLLLLLKKQVNDQSGSYERLLNIYLIGLIPALASIISGVNPSGVLRLTNYFSHTAILLWPMVFLSFRRVETKAIALSSFMLVALVYFVLTTFHFSDLTPYRINSELLW